MISAFPHSAKPAAAASPSAAAPSLAHISHYSDTQLEQFVERLAVILAKVPLDSICERLERLVEKAERKNAERKWRR